MADTKLSALTAAASALSTDEMLVNEGGTSKKITVAQLFTAPVFAAGSATAGSWPTMTPGTLLTTPEDGALEMDNQCFYACTDAGNRGVIPLEHLIIANATRTFASNTTQQAIFSTPTNGTLTLEPGTYLFECLLGMDTMSVTSGNGKFSLLGAGTATLAGILQFIHGVDIGFDTTSSLGGHGTQAATQTATNATSANASTELMLYVKGTFQVTVAGTIIPSFAQTTAAAAVVKIGSFFKCNRIGTATATNVGQWS